LSEVQQRNPGMGRREIERHFRDYLGIKRTIWLHNGIAGDDTHGHVDDLARFVSADTVVVASEPDKSDPNYEPLRENHALLRDAGARIRDDRQVERVWVQKFEPGRIFQFSRPSDVLSDALSGEKPLLFIRLGDDPAEGLV